MVAEGDGKEENLGLGEALIYVAVSSRHSLLSK